MYNIDEVRKLFEKEGYKLLSKTYDGCKQKLISTCPNGHEYKVSLAKWNSGNRCMCKYGKMRVTIEYAEKEFSRRGCKLLTKKYINGKRLDYICPNGNKCNIDWYQFTSGKVNIFNAGKPGITIAQVRAEFAKYGYTLLSTVYKNDKCKLKYRCKRGHTHSMSRNNWRTGYRCPECQPTFKKTIEVIRKGVERVGHRLITTEYKHRHQKLHTICPMGHDYFITWSNLQQGRFSGCPICKKWGTSNQEDSVIEFVKSICENVIIHDRTLIKPYELDIVIPDKRIAIEYCGLYWHSERMGKNKDYHLNKLELCRKIGYKLITVFEDELVYKKDIVFDRLKRLLCDKVILDEKYKISIISTRLASSFCNKYHIEGYNNITNINLGAFCCGNLVMVMSFLLKDSVWELIRFCSKIDHQDKKIAVGLLEHFQEGCKLNKVFARADKRWQDSDLYKQVGFRFLKQTKPNYWNIKNQRRIHRFIFEKLKDKPQKNNIIWDCGNEILVKEKDHCI